MERLPRPTPCVQQEPVGPYAPRTQVLGPKLVGHDQGLNLGGAAVDLGHQRIGMLPQVGAVGVQYLLEGRPVGTVVPIASRALLQSDRGFVIPREVKIRPDLL